MRLLLRRLDVSRSAPLRIQNELEAINSGYIDFSHGQLLEAHVPFPADISELPNQLSAPLELTSIPTNSEVSGKSLSRLELPAPWTSSKTSTQTPSHVELPPIPTSFELSGGALSQLRYRNVSVNSGLLSHASPRLEVPAVTTSRMPFNTNSLPMASIAEPIVELGIVEQQSQVQCKAWEFDWSAFHSPSQEAAVSDQHLQVVPDLPRLNGSMSDLPELIELGTSKQQIQSPHRIRDFEWSAFQSSFQEAAVPIPHAARNLPGLNGIVSAQFDAPRATMYTDTGSHEPTNLASEYIRPTLTTRVQQRQSSVITFHCDRLLSCARGCSCVCHSKQSYKSPGMLGKLVGSIFVGYTGLPMLTAKCDLDTCINQVPHSIRVSYTFPAWVVMKTLDFFAKSSSVSGPCFGLSVRNRVSEAFGMNILTASRHGDISTLIKLLEKRKVSISDIGLNGASPFAVRMQSSNL